MRRIVLIQPALPHYRVDFFRRLWRRYASDFVVFFTPGSLGLLAASGEPGWAVPVGSIVQFPWGFEWQIGVVRMHIRRGDIVVLSGNPRQLSTLVLLLRARIAGARVVWWGHYWSATSRRWRQVLRYLPMALAHALLFYTDEEVEAFRRDSWSSGKRRIIAALNNGIDIEPIRIARRPYSAVRRERALLFIGRLTQKADLELGLRAIARVQSQGLMLHVIGDGEMLPVLQALAESLGLARKVVWHGGVTAEDSIANIANRCQAFLYPGEVGLSLIHAMAYGLPAIIHDEPRRHMPEIAAFRDSVTGRLFHHGDADSLAKTIDSVLADPGVLNRLSSGALSAIGPNFTTEGMAERFHALVAQLEVAH